MSVSIGIIKKHGGLIELKNSSEAGTTFSVYLPVTKENANFFMKEVPELKIGNNERILVVDDEPLFLDLLRQILQTLAYRVTAVHSSIEVLEKLRLNPTDFDMLISDQTMPDMTGVQLAAEVHKINPGLPIILCTGYSDVVSKETAANFGIANFLMKPISQYELAQAVQEVLQKSKG